MFSYVKKKVVKGLPTGVYYTCEIILHGSKTADLDVRLKN